MSENIIPIDAAKKDRATGILVEESKRGERLVIASKAAEKIAEILNGKFAYEASSGVWHTFNGACWQPEITPTKFHKHLAKWLYKESQPLGFTPRYMDSALTLVQRADMLPLPKPSHFIPFRNGLLSPDNGQLIKVTPANAPTWTIPYDYVSDADCPRVYEWLLNATGDEAVVELLRAFMAAMLRGPAKYQKFLHLLGPGGTGKSTFIRLLQLLVGAENSVSTDLTKLEKSRFETASLYGKRLAVITEAGNYIGSVNVLKALTGQDAIRLERKHIQQSGSFTFEGLVVIASNETLATTDYTSGLERRRITVPFERVITTREKEAWREAGGENILHEEAAGIINWVLSMPLENVARIIHSPPPSIIAANAEAMRDSNSVVDWLMENCIPAFGVWTPIGIKEEIREYGQSSFISDKQHLYPNYLRYCQQTGKQPLSLQRFSAKAIDMLRNCLNTDVFKVRRNSGIGIAGIRLREGNEEAHNWQKQ